MLVDVAGADGREGAAEAVCACAAPCEGRGAGRRLLELGGIEFALGQRWRDDRSVLGGAHECEAARGLESLDGEDDVPCAALAEAELRSLRAQISPHFIYNALNTVASFIRTDPERARELLMEFERESSGETHPESAGFLSRVKELFAGFSG